MMLQKMSRSFKETKSFNRSLTVSAYSNALFRFAAISTRGIGFLPKIVVNTDWLRSSKKSNDPLYVALDLFEAEAKSLSIFGVPTETDDGAEGVVGLPKRFVSNCLFFFTDSGGVSTIADTESFTNALMLSALRVAT